jgi:hypothetical protein
MVSHRRLTGRRGLPRAVTGWFLDSGGYSELSLYGRWRTTEHAYVAAVRRYTDEIGHLELAAQQDWMTESSVRSRTGLSIRAHQRRTVSNYLRLRELAPDISFVPVLQGDSVTDYQRCADMFEHAGIDLAAAPRVGVGSVCRRQRSPIVEQIMRSLAARGLRLHGFGVKTGGLARYADALASSDSMAWSLRGRHVPGCSPGHRSESNCLRFALSWYQQIQATLGPPALATEDVHPDPVTRAA